MPIVKVYGVPENITQDILEKLCREICISVASVQVLEITEKQVTVFFPTDRLLRGLGEEIIVEVTGLYESLARSRNVLNQVATRIRQSIETDLVPHLPQWQKTEVFVYTFDILNQGFSQKRKKE